MPNRNPSPATRFKKGNPGGPGRPKLPNLNELLAKVLGEEKDGKVAAEAILAALRAKAAKGDVRAAEALLDRAFGKPVQRTDVTSGGEKIVSPPIVWVDATTPEPPRE